VLTDLIQEAALELGVTVQGFCISHSAAETEAFLEGAEVTAEELRDITDTLALVEHEHKLVLINAYNLSSIRDVLFAAFHELRHLWQEQEGWEGGNNSYLSPRELDANRFALERVNRASFEDRRLNPSVPSKVERTCRYYALAGVDLGENHGHLPHAA
jgi:Zn-dependent peptidase ImmA (M78 family)